MNEFYFVLEEERGRESCRTEGVERITNRHDSSQDFQRLWGFGAKTPGLGRLKHGQSLNYADIIEAPRIVILSISCYTIFYFNIEMRDNVSYVVNSLTSLMVSPSWFLIRESDGMYSSHVNTPRDHGFQHHSKLPAKAISPVSYTSRELISQGS